MKALEILEDSYDALLGRLFENAVQPALYALGLMHWSESAFEWIEFSLFGLLSILVSYAVCRPLEVWRPVEAVRDRRAIRTDIVYTLLSRLGLLPILAFVLLSFLKIHWEGLVADAGVIPPTLETLLPWLRDWPLLAFLLYVVVLDFGEYWRHRFQHMFRWWWALHSIHHAQRQMTFWTDNRNHVIDDAIAALWFSGLAVLIGVPPAQFPLILLILTVIESLSHANARLHFGRVGERLIVSPRFHRVHHGELSAGEKGRNYAVLFPIWDLLFGTADFDSRTPARTGDPDGPEALATGGWLRQQTEGLRYMIRSIARPRRTGGSQPSGTD
jgi:sterol desaturase/sphingolipid hydroxylase (fatty acid hydroxylase superfamily)